MSAQFGDIPLSVCIRLTLTLTLNTLLMCVAIPAKIKSIQDSLARVEIGGVERSASLQLTPEAKPGDYVLIHAGFAIHVIDEQEAQETLKLFQELEAIEKDA